MAIASHQALARLNEECDCLQNGYLNGGSGGCGSGNGAAGAQEQLEDNSRLGFDHFCGFKREYPHR